MQMFVTPVAVMTAGLSASACRNPRLYAGKVILAPMVRVGTLPMRLLALHSGADLVYSPEIVDRAIIGSHRLVNESSGTVDYVKDGRLIFQTHGFERSRLVFQLGTADPELALQAALTVESDVAAFDLNCGCPKRFSLQAGMGAALLKTPDRLVSILERLISGTRRPVSAKIRLFLPDRPAGAPHLDDTHALLRRIINTGVSAVTIHARDPAERSEQHPAHWDLFMQLAATVRDANIQQYGDNVAQHATLVLNGDIGLKTQCSYAENWPLRRVLHESGASSIMSARAAQWNPLLLRHLCGEVGRCHESTTAFPLDPLYQDIVAHDSSDTVFDASRKYLCFAQSVGNPFFNTKYALLQIWNHAATVSQSASGFDSAALAVRQQAREVAVAVQQARLPTDFTRIFDVPWKKATDVSVYGDSDPEM